MQNEIKTISQGQAGDIDGWITQTKRLHQDIARSKATAHEIVREAEAGRQKEAQVQDAKTKTQFLQNELAFSAILAEALEAIGAISTILDATQEAAVADRLPEAVDLLHTAEQSLARLQLYKTTAVVILIAQRVETLRGAIRETLEECWQAMVVVDRPHHRISLQHAVQSWSAFAPPRDVPANKVAGASIIEIDTVVTALESLGLLDSKLDILYQDLDAVVLSPLLDGSTRNPPVMIIINGDDLDTSTRHKTYSTMQLFQDLHDIVDYLSKRLPPSIAIPLSRTLMPSLTLRLISLWLNPAIPTSLEGIDEFQHLSGLVNEFINQVEVLSWTGTSSLTDWVGNAPRVWLAKRRESCLNTVRSVAAQGIKETKQVERVETEKVAQDEGGMFATDKDDSWNDNWSDDDKEENGPDTESKGPTENEVDEDVGAAWGLEDEETGESKAPSKEQRTREDAEDADVGDAWGWDNDDNDDNDEVNKAKDQGGASSTTPAPQADQASTPSKPRAPPLKTENSTRAPRQREVTLREHYTITNIPDQILLLINDVLRDASTLSDPSSTDPSSPFHSITRAAAGLYGLPTQILAMFRASSLVYYANHDAGKMFLYNDALYLTDLLRTLALDTTSTTTPARLTLPTDAQTLTRLGTRAYTAELSAHRQILSDLLDGAQGFLNCTTPPHASACETAVASTVSWLQSLHSRWQTILSRSVLLQTLGTLLGHAISKIIVEIEDLSDISEPESTRLVALCNRFLALEAIFLPPGPATEGQERIALTAVYTPSWLRFQYLVSILEGSLADIKYLWTEGELKLEFGKEEVVELIEALFADSEHRRRAIAEIKRG